jgi:hypothetical protein
MISELESTRQEVVMAYFYPVTYSKCHVTSNKAKSNLECAEEKFQTRGWVRVCEK